MVGRGPLEVGFVEKVFAYGDEKKSFALLRHLVFHRLQDARFDEHVAQFVDRLAYGVQGSAFVMRKQSSYIFADKNFRADGLHSARQFEEQGASGIVESTFLPA